MEIHMKVFDFKDIERKGLREVVPIDEKKLLNLSFKCVKDPKDGTWYGIPESLDQKTGRVLFKRITITGRRTYNLEYEEDAREYAVVKRHPSMLGSPFQKGKPIIKVYDSVAVAKKKLRDIDMGLEAVVIARSKLSGEDLIDFARILGISPENNDSLVVKQLVAEKAQRNPLEFMEKYSNANREIAAALKRGIAVGIIKDSLESGLVYRDSYPLGASEITAIAHLKQKTDLLSSIDIESKKLYRDKFSRSEDEEADEPLPTIKADVKPAPKEKVKEPELGNVPMQGQSKEEIESEDQESQWNPEDQLPEGPEDIPGGAKEVDMTVGDGLTNTDRQMIEKSGGAVDSEVSEKMEA